MMLTEKRSGELMQMNTELSNKAGSLESKYSDTIEELTRRWRARIFTNSSRRSLPMNVGP